MVSARFSIATYGVEIAPTSSKDLYSHGIDHLQMREVCLGISCPISLFS